MKIVDALVLDLILIMFPLMVFLLYVAYTKVFNKKENDLLIVVIIFTMMYLIFRYTKPFYKMPFFIINVPLVFAYYKKSKMSILITSIILVIYYFNFYGNFLPLIILEYCLVFCFRNNIYKFILFLSLTKTILTFVLLGYGFNINVLLQGIFLYFLSTFVIYLLGKSEDLLKLHMSYKEIKQSKQVKTSLFKITHEIKNPIAVCRGYLDMFDVNNPEHFRKYIPIVKEEIDRTLLLLEDFLSMNKLKINKDIIDINLLLEDVINSMNMMCRKNNIRLVSNIMDDEIYLKADYNRLTQVFVNLIKNSVEAMDKQGTININEELKNENVIITILDNGTGMNEELLKKIKEPFYTTKAKGTGLGVSLSSEIIDAHDGDLEYFSKEGEYTKVIVTLPIN